ncbi:hypothetical protein [Paenibacillus alvei]|uniref:hypothetical protein n=1 Tax=Paenibacillus alvei TaxID=44250 RepID=UPI00227F3FAD|nr:hypothetical protein [Paenibacillus alvei]
MQNSLEINIDPLVRARLKSLHSNLTNTDTDFLRFSNEAIQHYKAIREALPDNLQHTFFLYENAQSSKQTLLESKIYLHGFKDAIYLSEELHSSRF